MRARPRPNDAFGDPARRLVVLDQFEELFTALPQHWNERRGFVEALARALDDDPLLHVLIGLREDFLGDMLSFAPILPDRLRTRFRLPRLGHDEAQEAIEGPVRAAGLSFAGGVVDALLNHLMLVRVQTTPGVTSDVPGEFVEPVQLQVVCSSLSRSLPDGTTRITADHVRRFGDVTSALSSFYDRAVDQTALDTGLDADLIRSWFETTLITPAKTRSMAFRGTESTEGLPNPAVDVLENLHMIRAEVRAGARWYELTHDRFIGPIETSNAAHRPKERASPRWGVVPLVAGAALLASVVAIGPRHGIADALARFACGGIAALGGGQLVDAWLRNRRRKQPPDPAATPSSGRKRFIAVIGLGLLTMVGAVSGLTDRPGVNPNSQFPTYVSHLVPGLVVGGSPGCGGSNLHVYLWRPAPTIVDLVIVRSESPTSPGLVTNLARIWCGNEASSNILIAVVMLWAGVDLTVLGLLAQRRRRAGRVDRRTPFRSRWGGGIDQRSRRHRDEKNGDKSRPR